MSGDLVIAKVKGFPWSSRSPALVLRAHDCSRLHLVWARSRGLSLLLVQRWPARTVHVSPGVKKKGQSVLFFGTNKYAVCPKRSCFTLVDNFSMLAGRTDARRRALLSALDDARSTLAASPQGIRAEFDKAREEAGLAWSPRKLSALKLSNSANSKAPARCPIPDSTMQPSRRIEALHAREAATTRAASHLPAPGAIEDQVPARFQLKPVGFSPDREELRFKLAKRSAAQALGVDLPTSPVAAAQSASGLPTEEVSIFDFEAAHDFISDEERGRRRSFICDQREAHAN